MITHEVHIKYTLVQKQLKGHKWKVKTKHTFRTMATGLELAWQ